MHTMRKLFALALLALTLAFVAVGCGKKAEEAAPAPAAETPTMADTTAGMDSLSSMATDSTAGGH